MMSFIQYQEYKYILTGVHHTGNSLHTEYGHYVKKQREVEKDTLNKVTKQCETIVRNRCQCNVCKDIIESKSRHDFVQCHCRRIFTDGGTYYIRRGFTDPTDIIDLTEMQDSTLDTSDKT